MVIVKSDAKVPAEPQIEVILNENLSPEELAAFRKRFERYERNGAWLQAHAAEAYSHRGKYICIAGEELFVGDDLQEVMARAKAAHPEEVGMLTRYVPKERSPRIYAYRRILDPVQ